MLYFAATYHQITRFIQGYVENEVNLNAEKSCRSSCSSFKATKNFDCHSETLCAETHINLQSTKCNGTVYNCEKIDDDLTICPSWQRFDTRRYDYIRSSKDQTFGKFDRCLQTTKVCSIPISIAFSPISHLFVLK